jgi:hypothetical protein
MGLMGTELVGGEMRRACGLPQEPDEASTGWPPRQGVGRITALRRRDPIPAWDDVRGEVPELEDVAWGLWEQNSRRRPVRRVALLHEST